MSKRTIFAAALFVGVAAFGFSGSASAHGGGGGGFHGGGGGGFHGGGGGGFHGGGGGGFHGGGGGFHGGGGGFHPAPVHVPVHTTPVHVPVHTTPIHVPPPVHNPGHNPGFPGHNPGHNPGNPGHNPGNPGFPGHNPGHNPGNPGHTGNPHPGTPGHVGRGPITVHTGGPVGGWHAGHGSPAFHRGGIPHTTFVVVPRVHHVREPVFGVYGGHWRPLPRYDYITSFYWGGALYVGPDPFFWGYADWAPTEWVYYADTGEWWSPTGGWSTGPVDGYNDVISVAVKEKVQILDANGDPVLDQNGDPTYETITTYYNAHWDAGYGAYGYQSRSGNWVWLRW